nr:MAG TPA: hypothetical protein [Ackermannviridae sp.]
MKIQAFLVFVRIRAIMRIVVSSYLLMVVALSFPVFL